MGLQLYPWTTPVYERLEQAYLKQVLHHAVLFTGTSGLGRFDLCQSIASMLLCTAVRPAKPCGQCPGCSLVVAQSHPDYITLGTDTTDQTIAIEHIRSLTRQLEQKPHQGFNRVIIIREAHRLNAAAANALLKSLEEPPADTYLLFTSSRPYRLPATIRSRLQQYRMSLPNTELVIPWLSQLGDMPKNQAAQLLAMAQGSPLLAREYLHNDNSSLRGALQVIVDQFRQGRGSIDLLLSSLENHPPMNVLLMLENWLCALIRSAQTGADVHVGGAEVSQWLVDLARTLDCRAAYKLRDKIWRSIGLIESQINPNTNLLYIDCFLGLRALWPKRAAA